MVYFAALTTAIINGAHWGGFELQIGICTIRDMSNAHKRGRVIALYNIALLISPLLGPIVGHFLVENALRRWTLYVSSIVDALRAYLMGVFP